MGETIRGIEIRDRRAIREPRPGWREQVVPPRPEPDSDVRMNLVERVKGELAQGSYDEASRIDAILDKLAADLGVELYDEDESGQ